VSADEWRTIVDAYVDRYGGWRERDTLRLVPFNAVYARHRPDLFRTYRNWASVLGAGADLDQKLSTGAMSAITFAYYVSIGYAQGVEYYFRTVRRFGATRDELGDLLGLAAMQGGPPAWNPSTEQLGPFLDDIGTSDDAPGIEWPDGWAPDPAALRSGLDFSSPQLTPDELAGLERWHLDHVGEVPSYVGFFARYAPTTLKAFRARYEVAYRGALPKQAVPLFSFFVAMMHARPDSLRRAAFQARRYGVSRDHLVYVATRAQEAPRDVEATMSTLADALGDVFDTWDDAPA
jgi:hypothetical protein